MYVQGQVEASSGRTDIIRHMLYLTLIVSCTHVQNVCYFLVYWKILLIIQFWQEDDI